MSGILHSVWNVALQHLTGKTADDCDAGVPASKLQQRVASYLGRFDSSLNSKWDAQKDASTKKDRKENAQEMTNAYYDIATDFYEYGWGQSFHFAVCAFGESFATSIVRHEHQLAHRMNIRPGHKVLDIGCGLKPTKSH